MSTTPLPTRLQVQPRAQAYGMATPVEVPVTGLGAAGRLDPGLATEREEILDAVREDMDRGGAHDPARARAWAQLLAGVRKSY